MANTTTSNQVIHGDCTGVLQTLPSESIDTVITDPPYFVRYRDRSGREIANDDNPASVLGAFTDIYRVLRPDSFCICFLLLRLEPRRCVLPGMERRWIPTCRTPGLGKILRLKRAIR
jgi:hypothetical protein